MFQFEDFRVDPLRRTVMRGDRPIVMNRRAFDVLLFLVQNPGRVVTKDELLKSVWADAHVDENSLTQSISSLRKSLEERPGTGSFVKTLAGRGYQFTAPVTAVAETDHAGRSPGMATPEGAFLLHQQILTTTVVTEERKPAPRTGRRAFWIAAALLLACAGGYTWKRHTAPLRLYKIVVADFGNSTGDPVFERSLRRALEIDLGQSPYLEVLSEQEGVATLEQMGRKGDDAVTAALARDICVRTSHEVVVTGNIASVGRRYLLTLEATDCVSAKKLAGEKANAATKEDILAALDNMAERLRQKLGESAVSVADFEVPIQAATTPSLEALKAYSIASHMEAIGKEAPEILPFYQRAVELDPQFAMAYGAMAAQYYNASESVLAAQYYKKAFDLSRNGNALERLTIEASYYGVSDLQRSIGIHKLWTATYPRDWIPWQNLANEYNELGMTKEAIAAGEHALQLEPGRGNNYNVLIRAYKMAGRNQDAQRLGQEAVRRNLDSDAIHAFLFESALSANDHEALQRETSWIDARGDWFSVYVRAKAEAAFGRLHQADAFFERSRQMAARENLDEAADDILIDQAQGQYDLGMTAAARASRARITKPRPEAADLAELSAELDDTHYAEQFIAAHKDQTSDTLLTTRDLPQIRAAIAMTQHKPGEAVAALESTRTYWQANFSVLTQRGQAYMQEGKPELAAAEYLALLATPSTGAEPAIPLYNLAHLALARAYAAQGKGEESRKEYAVFFELWKDADADAPTLKQAKIEYNRLPK